MDLTITEMMQEKSKIEGEIKSRLNEFCNKYQITDINIGLCNYNCLGDKPVHIGGVVISVEHE